MADGLNQVLLLGNVGAEPELRFTAGGQGVLNLRMATSESYLDKDKVRRERTDWHNVVVWGKRGEALAKLIHKGSRILILGSLRTSSYDNKEGQKVYKTEVNANDVKLCGGRGDAESGGGEHAADPGDGGGHAEGGGGGEQKPATGGYPPRQAAAPRAAGGPHAGDFVVGFGRDKGKKISEIGDLSWLRSAMERDLADASKERFHDKTRGQLASIDNELARRAGGGAVKVAAATAPSGGGGGYAPRGGGTGGAPVEPPSDDYDPGSFGNDDDIPF